MAQLEFGPARRRADEIGEDGLDRVASLYRGDGDVVVDRILGEEAQQLLDVAAGEGGTEVSDDGFGGRHGGERSPGAGSAAIRSIRAWPSGSGRA